MECHECVTINMKWNEAAVQSVVPCRPVSLPLIDDLVDTLYFSSNVLK